jgi:hypothetical protein
MQIDFKESSLKVIFRMSRLLRIYKVFMKKNLISIIFKKILIRTKIPQGYFGKIKVTQKSKYGIYYMAATLFAPTAFQ